MNDDECPLSGWERTIGPISDSGFCLTLNIDEIIIELPNQYSELRIPQSLCPSHSPVKLKY